MTISLLPRRRFKRTVFLLAAIATLAFVAARPHYLVSILRFFQPAATWDFPEAGSRVALTFDDGPDPAFTPQVLAILARERIPATFFLIGERARSFSQIVAEIRAGGHEIGNHSWSGRATFFVPESEFSGDLLRTERILELPPGPVKWFRPASGWVRVWQIRAAERLGYTCVLGSSYAFDPYRPPAGAIALLIRRTLRPGGVIVLHDGGGDRSSTVAALPEIIRDARGRGLRFSRLSDMTDAR